VGHDQQGHVYGIAATAPVVILAIQETLVRKDRTLASHIEQSTLSTPGQALCRGDLAIGLVTVSTNLPNVMTRK
jgi:hypothetical protein